MANDYDLYVTIAEEIPYVQYLVKAVTIVEGIYNFGRENETDKAIRLLGEQVAVLQSDIADLNRRTDVLNRRVAQAENLARLRKLTEQHTQIQALALALARTPDVDELAVVAGTAALRVDDLLNDADLWLWSDIGRRTTPGGAEVTELADAEFKVLPLPVLAAGVAVFAIASWLHMTKEPSARAGYADRLGRFLAAVRVRTDWVDLQVAPVSLPEQIRSRITVSPHNVTRYVTAGQCTYGLVSVNSIDRTTTVLRDVTVPAPAGATGSTFCTAPADLGRVDEVEIEDGYPPIRLLATLEQLLDRLLRTGSLADPFVGQFPAETHHALFLYAVAPDGTLNRFECRLGTALTGPVAWATDRSQIGTGWQQFTAIVPGAWNVLYAVSADRSVRWYRHDGAPTNTAAWSGPTTVVPAHRSVGVQDESYVAGSNGIVYRAVRGSNAGGRPVDRVRLTSELTADRHPGVATGVGEFTGAVTIDTEWPRYVSQFGDTGGVIYGIDGEGRLFWHRHDDGPDGGTVQGPHQIGHGWNSFARVFSAGWGFLFGVYPNGRMLAYHLDNWRTGPSATDPARWRGPVPVAGGAWNSYLHLVPVIEAEPTGGVR